MAPPKKWEEVSVLIVEDEAHTRQIVKSILRQIGIHTVGEAEHGEAGLLELLRMRPSVVLCDVHMEPCNGREFLQLVRTNKLPGVRETPVIFLTADAERDTVLFAKEHQISGYLVKPVSAGQVRDKIAAALGLPVHH